MNRLRLSLLAFVFLIAVTAAFTAYWFVPVVNEESYSVRPSIVTCDVGLSGLLLTPTERRQLLYNDLGNSSGDQESDPWKMSDCRYFNLIQSLMTRPDPLKHLQLSSDSAMKRSHFSEVFII